MINHVTVGEKEHLQRERAKQTGSAQFMSRVTRER